MKRKGKVKHGANRIDIAMNFDLSILNVSLTAYYIARILFFLYFAWLYFLFAIAIETVKIPRNIYDN